MKRFGTGAAAAVKAVLAAVTETLAQGGPVRLAGFGPFAVRNRPARRGRNPRTGAPVDLPACSAVSFRPGKPLRRREPRARLIRAGMRQDDDGTCGDGDRRRDAGVAVPPPYRGLRGGVAGAGREDRRGGPGRAPSGMLLAALVLLLSGLFAPAARAQTTECDASATDIWCAAITVGNYHVLESHQYEWVGGEYTETVAPAPERERGFRRQFCVPRLGSPDAATPQARSRGDTCYGSIDDAEFEVGGNTYGIEGVYHYTHAGGLKIEFTSEVDVAALEGMTFTIAGVDYEVNERRVPGRGRSAYILWPVSLTGSSGWTVGETVIVRLRDPDTTSQQVAAPVVEGAPAVSAAGPDGQWTEGETVEVTVTFSEPVAVDTEGGTPSIGLSLGGTASRRAGYLRGSGTAALVFGYTLVEGDGSHGSMLVPANSLALVGGTIRSEATEAAAVLDHNGAGAVGFVGRSTRNAGPEAVFENLPPRHDGTSRFTVRLRFSGAPSGLSAQRDAASVLEVTGGTVTGARSASKAANAPWEVTVEPDGPGEVIVRVPVRSCDEAHAVCIGGQALGQAAQATVPGTPMTAAFTGAPDAHDGTAAFLLHLEFSHAPKKFSYRTVRDGLFDVTGGRIAKARRLERGRNLRWEVTVEPDGGGAVTLRRTRNHRLRGAIRGVRCGRAEVRGRPEPHGSGTAGAAGGVDFGGCVVAGDGRRGGSIRAAAHRGYGGGADGGGLAVTETGSVLTGAAPTSVTFAGGLGERDAERGDRGRRGGGSREHGDGGAVRGCGLRGGRGVGHGRGGRGGRRRGAGRRDGLAHRGCGERDGGGGAHGERCGHGCGEPRLVDPGGRCGRSGRGAVRADGGRRAVVWGGEGLRGAGRCGRGRGLRGHGAGDRRRQPGERGAGGAACGR